MAQLPMFAAISGSPQTVLSSSLSNVATTVYIDEMAYINLGLITIWTEETTWETCEVTAVSAASGPGNATIVRSGANHASSTGAALTWSSGAKVARNPTGREHDIFKANIEEHETRILAIEALDVNWSEVTGTTQALAVNKGYLLNNAAQVVGTLPATAAVGDIIQIAGKGAGGWKIAQNASQYISFGSLVSTTGVGGYVQSTNSGDGATLICETADVGWRIMSPCILDVV